MGSAERLGGREGLEGRMAPGVPAAPKKSLHIRIQTVLGGYGLTSPFSIREEWHTTAFLRGL